MATEANNKFKVMAESSANLLTDAEYAAEAERINGVVTGLASSILNNTSIRMNSIMAVALANFIARKQSGETIDTTLTPEAIDAFFEEALQAATDNAPSALVLPATYNSTDNRFEIADAVFPSGYVLPDQGKLTVKFPAITDAVELAELAVLRVLGTNYPLLVKDVPGNQPENSEVEGDVISVYRESTNIIINRNKPIETPEEEYDLSIQSQQSQVPVENSLFGDKKVDGASLIQLNAEGNLLTSVNWSQDVVIAGGIATLTGNGTVQTARYTFPQDFVIGTNVYVIVNIIENSLVGDDDVRINGVSGSNFSGQTSLVIDGSIGKKSVIIPVTVAGDTIDIWIPIGATSGDLKFDMTMQIMTDDTYLDGLTAPQIDDRVTGYFNGLKSVENPEIKVTNKNLLKEFFPDVVASISTPDIDYALDEWQVNIATISIENNIVLETGTTGNMVATRKKTIIGQDYTISMNEITSLATTVTLYINGVSVGNFTQDGNKWYKSFTAANSETDIMIRLSASSGGTKQFNQPQLELGTVATIYLKKDNSSKKYPLQILGDVPNGAADWIDTKNNILHELTKPYILQSGDITGLVTTDVNNDKVIIPLSAFTGVKDQITDIDGSFRVERFHIEISAFGSDVPGNEYKFSTSTTDLILYVPKGTYANLAAAQADLAGVATRYELAEEVITESIDSDEIALAYEKMTIEIIQDNGFSNSWFARHALNYEATVALLAAALKEAQKQIDASPSYKPILTTEASVSDNTSIPGANVFLSESYDNYEYLDIESQFSIGSQPALVTRVRVAEIQSAHIPVMTLKGDTNEQEYAFKLEVPVDHTTLTAYRGAVVTTTYDPTNTIVRAPNSGIKITEVYGVNLRSD